jgi:UPF0716 protein FxsA
MIGAWLAKNEGARVLREWQGAVKRGEIPKEGVTSSLLVLVGGVLLVTPGVVTDLFGLSLLLPPTRRLVASLVNKQVQKRFQIQTITPSLDTQSLGTPSLGGLGSVGFGPAEGEAPPRGEVIDVDADDVVEK